MSEVAKKFANDEYQKAHNDVAKDFQGKVVVVYKGPDGKKIPQFAPDLETLKLVSEMEGSLEMAYVGKVILDDGMYKGLEKVDLSKVKTRQLKLSEKDKKRIKKEIDKRRKEREENRQKIINYSSQIPNEIKALFEEMNHENSYAILACLLKEGEQTHPQLKEKLGMNDRTLVNSLNRMTMIVDQMAPLYLLKEKKSGETSGATTGPLEESTYRLSELGKDFISNVFATFEIPEKKDK